MEIPFYLLGESIIGPMENPAPQGKVIDSSPPSTLSTPQLLRTSSSGSVQGGSSSSSSSASVPAPRASQFTVTAHTRPTFASAPPSTSNSVASSPAVPRSSSSVSATSLSSSQSSRPSSPPPSSSFSLRSSSSSLGSMLSTQSPSSLSLPSLSLSDLPLPTPPTSPSLSPVNRLNGALPTPRKLMDDDFGSSRQKRFAKILSADTVDIGLLRTLSWKGIPSDYRPITWKLLLDYYPTNQSRREVSVERKRKEYHEAVMKYYYVPEETRTQEEAALYRQIQIDCPRTNPTVKLFQDLNIQGLLARVLYVWAIRHPASGYVQGINDLLTPFVTVFLSEHLDGTIDDWDASSFDAGLIAEVEADCYWCLTKLLDGIQDHYTFAQPGIQRMVHRMSELVHKVDPPLYDHLAQHEIAYLQFAFRWMNCLLLREFPLNLAARLWDTYFAELDSYPTFHVYVSAALLVRFSERMRQMDFQDIMLFLKNLPTEQWTEGEMELLLAQAFMWRALYGDSPKHLEHHE